VIRGVFKIYVEQSAVLMPAAAVVFLITGLLSAALVSASPGLTLIALILSVVGSALFTGIIVELVAEVRAGHSTLSVGYLLRSVLPFVWRLIGVAGSAITVLAESGGAAVGLLVRVVVGVLIAPLSSLAAAVLYFELREAREGTPAGFESGL
jgi:hypothetical protein